MNDHGKINWCCGAGGGVSANEDANEIKIKVFNFI
jgi:Fe-S oxidoreductase